MKKFCLLFMLLLPLTPAFGQGYFSNATTVGVNNVVVALPGAKVTICAFPATGQTSSTPCTNIVTTFTDQTLATPTSPGACTFGVSFCNPITADSQGNFGFWVPSGSYALSTCVGSYCVVSSPISTNAANLQLPITKSVVANNFLTGYNATTGVFSAAQPNGGGISAALFCPAGSASGTAYQCNTTPQFTPIDGTTIFLDADVVSGNSPTLAVNGAAAAPLKKYVTGASSPTSLVTNDIQPNQPLWVYFDAGLVQWTVMSPTALFTAAQMPALTGDVTSSAGSVATTVVQINGASVPASANLLGSNGSSQLVSAGARSQTIDADGADAIVNASTTSAQVMKTFAVGAGNENSVGKSFTVQAQGSYNALNVSQNLQISILVNGSVVSTWTKFPVATSGVNLGWKLTALCIVTVSGSSGTIRCGGDALAQNSQGANDTAINAGGYIPVSVTTNLVNTFNIQTQCTYSTTASTSNSCTNSLLLVEQKN